LEIASKSSVMISWLPMPPASAKLHSRGPAMQFS
jgi:hypothetical protein